MCLEIMRFAWVTNSLVKSPKGFMLLLHDVPRLMRVQEEHTGAIRCNASGQLRNASTIASLWKLQAWKTRNLMGNKMGIWAYLSYLLYVQKIWLVLAPLDTPSPCKASHTNPPSLRKSIEVESFNSKDATRCKAAFLNSLDTFFFPAKYSTMVKCGSKVTFDVQVRRRTIPSST